MKLATPTGGSSVKSAPLSATGSISMFVAYPERLRDADAPDWAAKAFHEDEVSARFALNAVRTGFPVEMERGIGPNGWWGAWWAVEIREKRSRDGTSQ